MKAIKEFLGIISLLGIAHSSAKKRNDGRKLENVLRMVATSIKKNVEMKIKGVNESVIN